MLLLDPLALRVRDIVVAVMPKLAKMDYPIDADLTDLGLSSVEAVVLLAEIERTFEIAVPDEDLTVENFSSIANLTALVKGLKPEEA